MSAASPISAGADGVTVRRISFLPEAPPGAAVLLEFATPQHMFALCETVAPDDVRWRLDAATRDDELLLVLLPPGSAAAPEWEPVAEARMQSDRLRWRPGRAVFSGAAERVPDVLTALAAFAFLEGRLRVLEREADEDAATARSDVPLIHSVTAADLRRRAHVDAMTRRVTLRQLAIPELGERLARPTAVSTGTARQLFDQLCENADVEERLESLGERTDTVCDLYELANDRLSEFRYFHSEWWLEIWIIIVLLVEVVLIVAEIYVNWRSSGGE